MTKSEFHWKDIAKETITAYVNRTEGAYLSEKECSVLFNYRDTDPELGEWQAKELLSHLDALLRPFKNECEIYSENGFLEVKPSGINKGTTVYHILKQIRQRKGVVDFILSIGDDISDEKIFQIIRALKQNKSSLLADRPHLKSFMCTIGRKTSLANCYVNDIQEVIQFLELLRSFSNKCKKNYSSDDLERISRVLSASRIKKKTHVTKELQFFGIEESEEENDLVSVLDIYKPKRKRKKVNLH